VQPEQLLPGSDGASHSELALSLPQRLKSVRAINPADLRARAIVNGSETALQQNAAGQFVGQFPVPARSSVLMQMAIASVTFSNVNSTPTRLTPGSGPILFQ